MPRSSTASKNGHHNGTQAAGVFEAQRLFLIEQLEALFDGKEEVTDIADKGVCIVGTKTAEEEGSDRGSESVLSYEDLSKQHKAPTLLVQACKEFQQKRKKLTVVLVSVARYAKQLLRDQLGKAYDDFIIYNNCVLYERQGKTTIYSHSGWLKDLALLHSDLKPRTVELFAYVRQYTNNFSDERQQLCTLDIGASTRNFRS